MAHYSRFSRKQAGVIFRAYKESKVIMEKEQVNRMYAFADAMLCQEGFDQDVETHLGWAVDYIFNNDYENAQKAINRAFFVGNPLDNVHPLMDA